VEIARSRSLSARARDEDDAPPSHIATLGMLLLLEQAYATAVPTIAEAAAGWL
jgi:hypothetical protein